MDAMLFCQNTRKTGSNAIMTEMSQAFHVAWLEHFTDLNLLKPFKICIQCHSALGNTRFTVLHLCIFNGAYFFISSIMVEGDESSWLRSWLTVQWFWPATGQYGMMKSSFLLSFLLFQACLQLMVL